jgi:hypothetical protein
MMFYQNQIKGEKSFSDSTRTRLPLPVATGGIGLFIAAASPGGLSGGAGFLIGFLIGLLLPALITVLSYLSRTKTQQMNLLHERSREIFAGDSLGEGLK